jgi:hypothetical protein
MTNPFRFGRKSLERASVFGLRLCRECDVVTTGQTNRLEYSWPPLGGDGWGADPRDCLLPESIVGLSWKLPVWLP